MYHPKLDWSFLSQGKRSWHSILTEVPVLFSGNPILPLAFRDNDSCIRCCTELKIIMRNSYGNKSKKFFPSKDFKPAYFIFSWFDDDIPLMRFIILWACLGDANTVKAPKLTWRSTFGPAIPSCLNFMVISCLPAKRPNRMFVLSISSWPSFSSLF